MSSIIDAEAFFKTLPELDGNSTLQGTVTALYEIGTFLFGNICFFFSFLSHKSLIHHEPMAWLIIFRMSFRRHLHACLW